MCFVKQFPTLDLASSSGWVYYRYDSDIEVNKFFFLTQVGLSKLFLIGHDFSIQKQLNVLFSKYVKLCQHKKFTKPFKFVHMQKE